MSMQWCKIESEVFQCFILAVKKVEGKGYFTHIIENCFLPNLTFKKCLGYNVMMQFLSYYLYIQIGYLWQRNAMNIIILKKNFLCLAVTLLFMNH